MPLLRLTRAAAVSVVMVAAAFAVPLLADGEPLEDGSLPCHPTGAQSRYLVLFAEGTSPEGASHEMTLACGSTVAYYGEIAVGVATSGDPRFAERVGRDRAFSTEAVEAAAGRHGRQAAQVTTGGGDTAEDRSGEQWDMGLIRADAAHAVTAGSRDVLVGVLDSGIDVTHPDLAHAVDASRSAGCVSGKADQNPAAWAPTTSVHGTHVAGIIAAADDGKGITGVAPGVRLASVKVVDDDGTVRPESVVCGLMWAAANGMAVANNSYFVDPWPLTCDRGEERVVFEAVRRAADYATGKGVLTVAAASNESLDLASPSGQTAGPDGQWRKLDSSCRVLPAGLRGVVAVSAVGPDRVKAGYSAYGLGVIDVTAPGGEPSTGRCVLSTVPGGYAQVCGTSMAAPHVSGVAALLASTHPGASPQKLMRLLTSQAESIACPADYDLDGAGGQDAYCSGYAPFNSFYGHGMVDALAAVTP
ncbi:S8 family peptidase [Actinokineospora globicatena]|uniref:S8 family peptidase n=1 Tax=Actinokineospora globicatena TaxID=103729 RepID=UPI0020A2E69C|nr:S8 family serine peptidase [Actinokineospora globicatena]MCP2305251.1 Subtilase family protein [Actinokineospora globicatena]GLW80727.1 serine protease [Actinokineospora globicatena]GLW87554.1 serine protease [Actinokineospora globicatena]